MLAPNGLNRLNIQIIEYTTQLDYNRPQWTQMHQNAPKPTQTDPNGHKQTQTDTNLPKQIPTDAKGTKTDLNLNRLKQTEKKNVVHIGHPKEEVNSVNYGNEHQV